MNSQLSSMTREIRLGVNVDHIATLRQARGTRYPDPVQAAFLAEEAGADGITIHLREDRRHIQERDVRLMKETLTTPMNLEIAVTDEMISFAKEIQPEHVCLVPEKREELTTEGGLDVVSNFDAVSQACQNLAASGIQVSLFIDADLEQIEASARAGAPAIELHTGQYAETEDEEERKAVLSKLYAGAKFAQEKGLIVNAGHGLHYHNARGILDMPALNELNIGHSIIARALFVGLKEAVREMKRLIESGTPHSKDSQL